MSIDLMMGLSIGKGGAAAAAPPASPPTFVGVSTAVASSDTVTPAPPAGVQANDVLIAFVGSDSGFDAFILNSGGTFTVVSGNLDMEGISGRVFRRVATSSEPPTYTFIDPNLPATKLRATIVAYRGVNTAAPVGDWEQGEVDNLTSHAHATPVTPVANNSMLVFGVAAPAGIAWTAPGGMNVRSNQSATVSVAVFDVVQADTSPVTKTATSGVATDGVNAILALTPA